MGEQLLQEFTDLQKEGAERKELPTSTVTQTTEKSTIAQVYEKQAGEEISAAAVKTMRNGNSLLWSMI